MKMRRDLRRFSALALASACGGVLFLHAAPGPRAATAEIRIVKANGEPVPNGAATLAFNPETGGWVINLLSLYAPNLDTVYEIRANGDEVIDSIVSHINGPAAGSPLIIRVFGEAPGYLRSVHQFTQIGNAETILNRVIVTEDIGAVQVEAIGDLIAGRDILGPITATTANNSVRGVSNARAGRHIRGHITADNGRILVVSAPNGDVGSANQPITIRARHSVYHITAQNLHAHINTRYNGGSGGIYALDVQRFFGSLIAEKLIYNPWTNTDGWISISQQMGGTITFGKFFNNPAQWIQLPVQGLSHQIIINADNASGSSGWTSPIRVGPNGHPNQIVLNNPSYAQTPAMLGGGSVGLVPFRLHHAACVPPSGATVHVPPSGSAAFSVQLRHYGPVTWSGASQSTAPVTIERRPAGSAQTFVAAPLDDFAIVTPLAGGPMLTITAAPNRTGFSPGYEYRLRATSQLKCDLPNLASAPNVQWTGDYFVTVIESAAVCIGDVNNDGVVGVPDLLAIIGHWGPVGSFPQGDINHDGAIGVPDLLAVIAHWGACP